MIFFSSIHLHANRKFHSFLWLNKIPLYINTTFSKFIHQFLPEFLISSNGTVVWYLFLSNGKLSKHIKKANKKYPSIFAY
jgi:hypothetical protein